MLMLCLACLLVPALATPLYGSSSCTWGPSYWCSYAKTAKECKAVDHCMNNVWNKAKIPATKNSPLCATCELFVGKILTSETSIESALDSACSAIPEASYQRKCLSAVKEYTAIIVQLIKEEVDPKIICSLIELCDSSKKTSSVFLHKSGSLRGFKTLVSLKSAGVGSVECTACKAAVAEVRARLLNGSVKEMEAYLDKRLCSRLGGLEDLCTQVVSAYSPEIMKMLKLELDPATVCSAISMCQNGTALLRGKQIKTKLTSKDSAGVCDKCKDVMQQVIDFVDENTTEADVEKFLNNVLCPGFGSMEGLCKQLVTEYVPALFQLIQNKASADELCSLIGLCTTMQMKNAEPVKVPSAGECALCTLVIKEVEDMLSNNKTEAEIVKALDSVCALLPSSLSAECDNFVNQYATAIINLIVLEVDPKEICTLLSLCSGSNKLGLKDSVCDLCQFAVSYVDRQLQTNKSVEEIEQALKEACGYLPSNLQDECNQLVMQYGPMIIKLLTQSVDPKQVCQELGLCSNGKQLLGADLCTRGPAYWCASRDNARRCKTESHCEAHVWVN